LRVLVTGAGGFVGASFLTALLRSGHHQVAILLRPETRLWRIEALLPKIEVLVADLGARRELAASLSQFQPDAIVHLAWDGVLGRDRNCIAQWRNLPAASLLLESAAAAGAKHFIAMGSHAEYGPSPDRITEDDWPHPTTLYGAAKLATCILAEAMSQELGVRFAWLRLFSSYGPRDNPEWLVPHLIVQLLQRARPSVTKAEQLWDYLYVDNVADALLKVLDTPQATGVFNLGSGSALPLRRIIETVRDMVDPSLEVGFGEVPYRPDQVMHLEAAIGRLTAATGWRPVTSLEQGLATTLDWYRKHGALARFA
jgi:nucleoside-diphosphate-sugar epimerase